MAALWRRNGTPKIGVVGMFLLLVLSLLTTAQEAPVGRPVLPTEWLSADQKERSFNAPAFVVERIVATQSPRVDAMTGATVSCLGVMEAVEGALRSARPAGTP